MRRLQTLLLHMEECRWGQLFAEDKTLAKWRGRRAIAAGPTTCSGASSKPDDEQTDEQSRPAASVGDFAKLSGALPNASHEVGGDPFGGGGGNGSKHSSTSVFAQLRKTP